MDPTLDPAAKLELHPDKWPNSYFGFDRVEYVFSLEEAMEMCEQEPSFGAALYIVSWNMIFMIFQYNMNGFSDNYDPNCITLVPKEAAEPAL